MVCTKKVSIATQQGEWLQESEVGENKRAEE